MTRRIPRWLTAELTYRCPLNCFYCSNPLQMSTKNELSTTEWVSTFRQAREMGSVQLGFTGGEPLMRADLPTLIKEARGMGFYTNLITSAVGMSEKKLEALKSAGLDSVQISFQAEQRDLNAFIGGKDSYDHKLRMMRAVRAAGLPLTLNVVIHRLNIDRVVDICKLCESMEPDHVEVASTQFHGWARANAHVLMPTPEQVERARSAIEAYQSSSQATTGVYYVLSDLIEKRAKRCHQGWGSTYLCVNPQGDITPCLSAHTLPSLQGKIENVHTHTLQEVWDGPVFAQYQGIDWMDEDEAKRHPRRAADAGGCRCQAYMLTRCETAMDPVDESARGHAHFVDWVRTTYTTPTSLHSLRPRKVGP